MAEIEFIYLKNRYEIEIKDGNTLIYEILNKYERLTNQKFIFLYKGINLKSNKNLKVKDLNNIKANIFVLNVENLKKINHKEKEGKIICPICKEDANININSFEISQENCMNNHKFTNCPLKAFMDLQIVDKEDIECDICKNNREHYKLFYICSCKANLCPLCVDLHKKYDYKNHNTIYLEEIYYKCALHSKEYISYCKTCNINLCEKCENNHLDHNILLYKKIMPNEIKKNEIKNYIKNTSDKIKDYIEKIKMNSTQYINRFLKNLSSYIYLLNKLNDLIKNLKNYQNIKTITDLNIKKLDKDINTYVENINKLIDIKNEITIIYKKARFVEKGTNLYLKIVL